MAGSNPFKSPSLQAAWSANSTNATNFFEAAASVLEGAKNSYLNDPNGKVIGGNGLTNAQRYENLVAEINKYTGGSGAGNSFAGTKGLFEQVSMSTDATNALARLTFEAGIGKGIIQGKSGGSEGSGEGQALTLNAFTVPEVKGDGGGAGTATGEAGLPANLPALGEGAARPDGVASENPPNTPTAPPTTTPPSSATSTPSTTAQTPSQKEQEKQRQARVDNANEKLQGRIDTPVCKIFRLFEILSPKYGYGLASTPF